MGWFSRKKEPVQREDGWYSALGGFGVPGKDRRQSTGFVDNAVTDATAMSLWRSEDIAARIVEVPAREALRQGFTLNAGDKELSESIKTKLEELNVLAIYMFAMMLERAYGGAAIYPVINDGADNLREPLNEQRISSVSHLITFEPRELVPSAYYLNPTDKLFREPSMYRVQPYSRGGAVPSFEIHESRLITFPGIRVSASQQDSMNNGWGDSVLNRVINVLRDYGIAWSATGVLLSEFSQASIKMKGLAELMATDKDDVIKNRIKAIELSRSTINAVLMDAEEEYERKQTPVAGLAELLKDFATRVAAAAEMPVTLLMGQSPSGLNATGESDIRFFYDRTKTRQTLDLQPRLEKLIRMIMLSIDGPTGGKEPDNWKVEFVPLWQPSEKEIAETRKIVADTDAVLINSMVVSPEEIALSRYGGDSYSMETTIDWEERQKVVDTQTTPDADDVVEVEGEGEEEAEPTVTTENVAATAMNGAQVTSLMGVIEKVGLGTISRESALGVLKVAFRVTEEEALDILGPASFVPAAPEPKFDANDPVKGWFMPNTSGSRLTELPEYIRVLMDEEEIDTFNFALKQGERIITVHRHGAGHPRHLIWRQVSEGVWE